MAWRQHGMTRLSEVVRSRRPYLVATVCTFVLLPSIITACGNAEATGRSEDNQVVPWVAAPPPPYVTPTPLPTAPPPTDAPPCRSAHLSLAYVGENGAGGHVLIAIAFKNTGAAPCLLSGVPRVVAAAPGRATVVAGPGGMPPWGWVADIAPGASAAVQLDVPDDCGSGGGHSVEYPGVVVYLPAGGAKTVKVPGLALTCGMSASQLALPEPAPRYPPDILATLVPRLRLPAYVRAGTMMGYEVDLFNPRDRPVALSPCPSYLEWSSIPTKQPHLLNCQHVRSIPARGEVRYQMEMAVPADAPSGPTEVFWALEAAMVPPGRGSVRVRR